jgi:hypothetical protein
MLLGGATVGLAQETQPAVQGGPSISEFGVAPDGSSVIFDFGPTSGAQAGCWQNITDFQNFAEQANLAAGGIVDTITIFTCISPVGGTVHVKILADDGAGNPDDGIVLYQEDKTPDAWVSEPITGGFQVVVNLTTPFLANPGTTYWYGVSGNGFELGQYSVATPGDGTMAQFSASTFVGHAGVGDQMFQLIGGPVPVELQTFTID